MKLYPQGVLEKFDFETIRSWLEGYCVTEMGLDIATNLTPYSSYQNIQRHLVLTGEMVQLTEEHSFPITAVEKISTFLSLIEKEGYTADIKQVIGIRNIAQSIQTIRKFIHEKEDIDTLRGLIHRVKFDKKILTLINQVLANDGKIKNNASNVLAVIRDEQYRTQQELNKAFRTELSKFNRLNYLTDTKESIRNGRRVLTVKAEHKRRIKGVIHDISETGQTAFIEPNSALQLSNELLNLEQDERVEIQRILRQLTADIRPFVPLIRSYEDLLGKLDFTRAKASLARQMNASIPKFVDYPHLSIKEAFHPVLKAQNDKAGKFTQSLDLELNKNERIIVISGPNAGGKSVTMKTVGLLQLMIQSGIPVPVHPESTMGLFTQFYAEIGDEQSIEDELSTYSSKLQAMNFFLKNVNKDSLIFIDEFGSGTDPNLGGAVAQSILESLNRKKVFGIVTTHYLNLKSLANDLGGLKNGAMLFDEETLKPMYKMETGKPGSSYTFAIAQTSGLPLPIINRAKQLTGDEVELDELLTSTQKSQTDILLKQLEVETKLRELEQKEQALNQLKKKVERERNTYQIHEKNQEIAILAEVKKRFNEYVKQLQKVNNQAQSVEHIREALNNELETSREIVKKKVRKKAGKQVKSDEIRVGDKVKWILNDSMGEVLSIKNGKAEVQMGTIRSRIPVLDLVHTNKITKVKVSATPKVSGIKEAKFEIDIRGKRFEEATTILQDFFDQAVINRLNYLRILHGKGNGTLRELTKKVAKTYKASSITHPHPEEGGDGISIVQF